MIDVPVGYSETHYLAEGQASYKLWWSERIIQITYGKSTPIRAVRVTVLNPEKAGGTDWWGWYAEEKGSISKLHLIFKSWPLLSVCFPYGLKAEEDAGRGRIVRLKLEFLE